MGFSRTGKNAPTTVDVAILGAGPAGAATALALRRIGVDNILLLDKPLRTPFRVGESATPDIAAHLSRLGLDHDLTALGHRPYYGSLSLWGGAAPLEKDFLRYGQGHGWHLQRAAFDAWLCENAVAAGVSRWSPASLVDVKPVVNGGWYLQVRRGGLETQIFARVLVDASGRRAVLAGRLGIARRNLDGLLALAVRVAPPYPKPLRGWTLIEAVRQGWWYAAPLPDGTAIVMLMSDIGIIRQEMLAKPKRLQQAWQDTQLLRESFPTPPVDALRPAIFPAMTGFLERAAGPGWLAVGDALLSMDPLTSSGIVGALSDAEAAATTIRSWLHTPQAWRETGNTYARRAEQTLERYLSERRRYYGHERRWPDAPFWSARQT